MSMQIQVDPAGLTQAQREAVAGFILAYPTGGVASSSVDVAVEGDKETVRLRVPAPVAVEGDKETVRLRVPAPVAAMVSANLAGAVDAIADLAKEGGEFDASVAFGGHGSTELDADAAKLNATFGQGTAGATLGDLGLAAAAFGNPAPLPPGATAAPSIAAVAPSLTAPGVMPATISPATLSVPVPPAPTPASVAPPAAPLTASPAAGVELDANGLPWNAKIHAESKAKIADGTWRKKRGVDPALVAQVEAELRQVMGAAPVPNVPPPPPVIPAPAASVPMPGNPGLQSSPVAPSAPAGQNAGFAQPVAPASDPRQAFVALVGRASAAMHAQKITQAEINQICAPTGVPALPLLANRLDLVPQIAAQIDALIASRA